MKHRSLQRVLAIDLHPRRFGYVVLEGPTRVLDWGVRTSRQKGKAADALISAQLRPLLELWQPTVLVLGEGPSQTRTSPQRRDRLLRRIATEAKIHRIAVRTVKKRSRAVDGEKITKYENARRVAEHFSVLQWTLPPKRKPWESEDYRMGVFTAATLAMVQLNAIPFDPAIPEGLRRPWFAKPAFSQTDAASSSAQEG